MYLGGFDTDKEAAFAHDLTCKHFTLLLEGSMHTAMPLAMQTRAVDELNCLLE